VSPSYRRRLGALAATALAASIAAVPAASTATAGGWSSGYTTNCPPAESLVKGTTWHSHKLAPGVYLKEGQRHDSFQGGTGTVDMHVLTMYVTTPHLTFKPIVRKLAMRTKLSTLASGNRKLVAATNSGFFDFRYGTPQGPVVSAGTPMLASRSKQMVVGFNRHHLVQAGHLSLTGTLTDNGVVHSLAGLNVLYPTTGLTVYTPKWGSTQIPLPRDAISRYVVNGQVSTEPRNYSYAPSHGYLVVARGSVATNWLHYTVHTGDHMTMTRTVTTDAPSRFTRAFAVGTEIVLPGGKARTGLKCRRSYPQPARTAIGFADHGKKLIIAVIADHPGTSLHGLDTDQVSRVMVDLGASQAYTFDGSGSTELLARMPSRPQRLSLRNYPADGGPDYERPMPVGFGVYYYG
jgi:hypothetical protein